jgi:hypothetical protein
MTGDNLFTHQRPRALQVCGPEMIKQHPDLAAIVVPTEFSSSTELWAWVTGTEASYFAARGGEDTLPVSPLEQWQQIDPIEELIDMRRRLDS